MNNVCGDVHLEYVPLSCSLTLFTYCTSYCTVYSYYSLYVVLVLALLASATSTSAAYITRSCTRISHARHRAVVSLASAPLLSLHPDLEVWVPTTTTTTSTTLHLATSRLRIQAILRLSHLQAILLVSSAFLYRFFILHCFFILRLL